MKELIGEIQKKEAAASRISKGWEGSCMFVAGMQERVLR
jgi:hypothetical protein